MEHRKLPYLVHF